MSHARKIFDPAIAMIIRKIYNFKDGQLGFRQGKGMETAILQQISNSKLMGVAAVLDLKAAYDSMPSRKLFDFIKDTTVDSMIRIL